MVMVVVMLLKADKLNLCRNKGTHQKREIEKDQIRAEQYIHTVKGILTAKNWKRSQNRQHRSRLHASSKWMMQNECKAKSNVLHLVLAM